MQKILKLFGKRMFPTSKFKLFACPEFPQCSRSFCIYSHELAQNRFIDSFVANRNSQRSVSTKRKADEIETIVDGESKVGKAKNNIPLYAEPVARPRPPAPEQKLTALEVPPPIVESISGPKEQKLIEKSTVCKLDVHPSQETPKTEPTSNSGPPRVKLVGLSSKIAVEKRQKVLNLIFEEFKRIYNHIEALESENVAKAHAEAQEQTLHSKTSKASYMSSAALLLTRLKRRKPAKDKTDTGLDGQYNETASTSTYLLQPNWTSEELEMCITPEPTLEKLGYVLTIPDRQASAEVGDKLRVCDRCGTKFQVTYPLSEHDMRACQFHWGRKTYSKREGKQVRIYQCCGTVVEKSEAPSTSHGCQLGPHVFKEEDADEVARRIKFVKTREPISDIQAHKLLAMDCEMCHTTAGLELCRLTIIQSSGAVLTDVLVAPTAPVVDLNTRFSGITAEMLEINSETGRSHAPARKSALKSKLALISFEEAQQVALRYISAETALVGHGLENDLKVLGLVHTRVIDTVHLFPHHKGLPFRMSLKKLAQVHLKKSIQTGASIDVSDTPQQSSLGHCSIEDAQTCLELLNLYRNAKARAV